MTGRLRYYAAANRQKIVDIAAVAHEALADAAYATTRDRDNDRQDVLGPRSGGGDELHESDFRRLALRLPVRRMSRPDDASGAVPFNY